MAQWRAIATIQGKGDPQVSYDAKLTRAIVWLDPRDEAEGTPARAWSVKLPNGPAEAFTLPKVAGKIENVVFSRTNRPTVLALHDSFASDGPKEGQDAKGRFMRYEGKVVRMPDPETEGVLAMAHAYTLDGGTWKRVESKPTTTGWDYGAGVDALKIAEDLYPSSRSMRNMRERIGEVENAALLKRQDALKPKAVDRDGEGGQVTTSAGPVWVWREQGEFLHETSLIAWGDPKRPTLLPGLAAANSDVRFVAVQPRDNFVLVTDNDGRYPRLYDVATKKRVWAADAVFGATLWPR